jgi:hypothetical protein
MMSFPNASHETIDSQEISQSTIHVSALRSEKKHCMSCTLSCVFVSHDKQELMALLTNVCKSRQIELVLAMKLVPKFI